MMFRKRGGYGVCFTSFVTPDKRDIQTNIFSDLFYLFFLFLFYFFYFFVKRCTIFTHRCQVDRPEQTVEIGVCFVCSSSNILDTSIDFQVIGAILFFFLRLTPIF